MDSPDALKSRLGELVRKRRAGALQPVPDAALGAARDEAGPIKPMRRRRKLDAGAGRPLGVEAYLPGGEWRDEKGVAVYIHERLRSDVEKRKPHWGRLPEPPPGEPELSAIRASGLERGLFLDLETCGLSSSPVFLAGTMFWNGEDFVIRQYFARHYGEEVALLNALHQQTRAFDLLVTFNGKSYDAPFLQSRAQTHRVAMQLPPRHLDLLHASRRRWKGRLPDCRLTTIERHVTRRRRVGDVSGAEVPDLYHAFVKSGDPYPLVPVFHHNLLDVITMAEILDALCRPEKASATVWE